MASALRLSQSALRAAAPMRTSAFTGLRAYSSKTQVCAQHAVPYDFHR